MNIKLLSGITRQLGILKKDSLKRVTVSRKMLIKQGQIANDLTTAEVIKVARRQSRMAQKNLLRQLLQNARYRREVLPALIRSKVLGSIEEVLNLVSQRSRGLSLITQEFLSPDIFLKLSKQDQKQVVAANSKEVSENFLYRYLLNDEQLAIKILLELHHAGLAKIFDALFSVSEDARVFESKYLTEGETLKLIAKLNERRLQKILEIRENFLLIAYAARYQVGLLVELFETAKPYSIQNFFNYCLENENEKNSSRPRVKRMTIPEAQKIIRELTLEAHHNRTLSNPAMIAVMVLLQNPKGLMKSLSELESNAQKKALAAAFGRDFAQKKTPEKITMIDRKQFLIELLTQFSKRPKILNKMMESISEDNQLIVKKILKVRD